MLVLSELRNDGLTCREKQKNLKSKSRWTKHKYFDRLEMETRLNGARYYGDLCVDVFGILIMNTSANNFGTFFLHKAKKEIVFLVPHRI